MLLCTYLFGYTMAAYLKDICYAAIDSYLITPSKHYKNRLQRLEIAGSSWHWRHKKEAVVLCEGNLNQANTWPQILISNAGVSEFSQQTLNLRICGFIFAPSPESLPKHITYETRVQSVGRYAPGQFCPQCNRNNRQLTAEYQEALVEFHHSRAICHSSLWNDNVVSYSYQSRTATTSLKWLKISG